MNAWNDEERAEYQAQADYLSKKMRIKARQIKRLRAHLKKVVRRCPAIDEEEKANDERYESAAAAEERTDEVAIELKRRQSRAKSRNGTSIMTTTTTTTTLASPTDQHHNQHSSTHSIALKLFKDIKTLQLKILNEDGDDENKAQNCMLQRK